MFLWPAPILGVSLIFAASTECASGSVYLALERAYSIPALKELTSPVGDT